MVNDILGRALGPAGIDLGIDQKRPKDTDGQTLVPWKEGKKALGTRLVTILWLYAM